MLANLANQILHQFAIQCCFEQWERQIYAQLMLVDSFHTVCLFVCLFFFYKIIYGDSDFCFSNYLYMYMYTSSTENQSNPMRQLGVYKVFTL